MSTLQNEVILENIYEEVIAEATDTGNIAMMTIEDVEFEVIVVSKIYLTKHTLFIFLLCQIKHFVH